MPDIIFSIRIPFTDRHLTLVDRMDELLPEEGLHERVRRLEATDEQREKEP